VIACAALKEKRVRTTSVVRVNMKLCSFVTMVEATELDDLTYR